MTHVSYIAAAYVIAVGLPMIYSIDALIRVWSARRRLQAIDVRRDRDRI